VQALLELVFHVPHGTDVGNAIVQPMLVTLVYAFVWIDARDEESPPMTAWERLLERAWAVIVIDFLFGQVAGLALALAIAPDPVFVVLGILGCALSALLIFADASATVDDDATAWTLIPKSVVKSVATAWHAVTFSRALAIFSIQLLFFAIESGLTDLLTNAHAADPAFWGFVPLSVLVTPAFAAVTAVVYCDATAPEKQAGSSSIV